MPTFEETYGTAEAQRIAYQSLQKVTQSAQPLVDWGVALKDCGITTPSRRDQLLHEVDSQVRQRHFKTNPRFVKNLTFDSDVSSLVKIILYSLPGSEDFPEPPAEDFQTPLKRRRVIKR